MIEETKPSNFNSTAEAVTFINDWVTVEEFCNTFPNIPEKTLRWQLTTRDRNGLSQYVQVIGKRRYISIQGYAAWLRQNMEVTCG
jgi:hypothetical protein